MTTSRRKFLQTTCRGAALVAIGGTAAVLWNRGQVDSSATVWQIDPFKCIGCKGCFDHCVLQSSAVKCFHNSKMCGFCELCTGYFDPEPIELHSGAENQLCPTNAIRRIFIEEPYFQYEIETDLCVGCGKCVKGCTAFGNGSLFLQIDQSLCTQCNQCAIAAECPAEAIRRVPAVTPYTLKLRQE